MPEEGHVGREKKREETGAPTLDSFPPRQHFISLLVRLKSPARLQPDPKAPSQPSSHSPSARPTSNFPARCPYSHPSPHLQIPQVIPYQSRTSSRTSDTFFKADTVLLPTDRLDPGTEPSPPSAIHTTK